MAQRGRKSHCIPTLTPDQEAALKALTRAQTTPHGLARRAHGILLVTHGMPISTAAKATDITRQHLAKWIRRYLELGMEGIMDRRAGRPRTKTE